MNTFHLTEEDEICYLFQQWPQGMPAFRASSTGELQKEAQFLRYYLCFWMACYLLLLVLRSETILDTD